MIRHVVLVRLAPEQAEEWPDIVDALVRFSKELPGVLAVGAGPNVSPEPGMDQGFSEGLVIDFEDEAARDGYLVHPTHVELGARLVTAAGGLGGVVVFDLAF